MKLFVSFWETSSGFTDSYDGPGNIIIIFRKIKTDKDLRDLESKIEDKLDKSGKYVTIICYRELT